MMLGGRSWSVERDPRVGACNEVKDPDCGARSCSEVVEQEWLQQSLVSVSIVAQELGAKQTRFWCVL